MCKERLVFFISVFFVSALVASGQESALVVLRPAAADANTCATDTDHAPRTIAIRGIKIQGKEQIRLAGELGKVTAETGIIQRQFKSLRAQKIKDLSEIEVRDGLMYVAAGEGQKLLAIPDVEPTKVGRTTMGQYAEMSLEADSGDRKSKQKQILALKNIWRVFILSPSLTADEALFRHAQQSGSVSQWTFYLSKVTSYRIKEAGDGLAEATAGCLDKAMTRFRGGDFGAIEEAKQMAQKIVAMSGGSGSAAERLGKIRMEEQGVRDRIRDGKQLRKEGKWDDALAVWEPVQVYLKDPTLKDFADAHAEAVERSHSIHIEAAQSFEKNAWQRGMTLEPDSEGPIRKALAEYETALRRIPDSAVARQGRREMLIRLGLIDASKYRNSRNPGKAHDLLVKLKAEQGDDPRVAEESKLASCEYGAQLYDRSRGLVVRTGSMPPAPKPAGAKPGTASRPGSAATRPPKQPTASEQATVAVRGIQTVADKKPFVEARDNLVQALGLCPTDDAVKLLAKVNSALADYHVAKAKLASMRKMHATALLHLNAAQYYQPDRPEVEGLLSQERPAVERRVRVQAGVVIRSTSSDCAEPAQQIAAGLESALTSGGANLQLITREQAEQTLRKIRSGAAGALADNYVILSGQIGACTLSVSGQPRMVQSRYQVANENYNNLSQGIQEYDRRIDDCKRTYGANEAQACRGLRNERQGLRDRLARETPINMIPYTYRERPVTVTGQMRMTLQIDDTIAKGSRNAGEAVAVLNENCTDRQGVRDDDASGGVVRDNACPPPDHAAKLLEMTEQVREQAQQRAVDAVRSVANGYLELARRATDQEAALEHYIVYVLLASDRSSSECQEAMNSIHARDADLKPESALH